MKAVWRHTLSCLILPVCLLSLAACSSDKGTKDDVDAPAKRVAVLEQSRVVKPDEGLKDFAFRFPEPALIRDWAQTGGNTQHIIGHASLPKVPEEIWSTSIGTGSGGYFKLLASPVVQDGVLYAMDARGRVSAYDTKDGDRTWRVGTNPADKEDESAIGGGIAVEGKVLYATTGFGEVIAMRTYDGAVMWRKQIGKPIRSAPTVAEGRVFAIDIENETYALDSSTGFVMWKHSGIAENATLMGTSSPAVHGDTVVVAYSSGELFGLRAQNGRVVWSEVLAVPTQIGALPAIADIRGLPVIDEGRVYSVSHSGRAASVVERTGDRGWEADFGGMNTPCVIGNAVFLVTLDSHLVALERDTGRLIWTIDLQKLEDPDDNDSKNISWWGPVFAGGRLWLTNSIGHLAAYAPETGSPLYDKEIGKSFFLPPIVAQGTLYLLDDSGELYALK